MNAKLLVDISAAVNQGAGIGRYARELTRRLIPMLPSEAAELWYAEDDSPYDPGLVESRPWAGLRIRKSPISRTNVDRLLVRQSIPIQRLLRLGDPSDVYSPDFTAPTPKGSRTHITVHDLAWLHPEAETPEPLARFLLPVVERAVGSASTVFTVSDAVRQEIMQHYSVPPERVIVAPNAAAPHFHGALPMEDDALVTFGLRRPFLLSVGTIEPRKNLSTLFEAMTMLPPSYQLAVVGRSGWGAESIMNQIDELNLSGRVVRIGFVSDTKLPGLMASASAVIYPSRYEGFGLPVVEALATGTPVVASELPVFREVGGDSVVYFDPSNADDLVTAIERSVSSSRGEMQRRSRMVRARMFDWNRSAEIVARRLQEFN